MQSQGKFDKAVSGNLANPLGHTWDQDGNLYVACFNSKDIHKFGADGQSLGCSFSSWYFKRPIESLVR